MSRQLLVFTDLDGSLLDHHTYSYEAAFPTLEKLERHHVPVILVSSKTRDEIVSIRSEMGNDYPAIIENGAAVMIPDGYFSQAIGHDRVVDGYQIKSFCEGREHWQQLIDEEIGDDRSSIVTFADAGVDGIMAMTSLDEAAALKASIREFGEPFQWRGSDDKRDEFIDRLIERGANVLRGGRFFHVSGDCDKGRAVSWLLERYRNEHKDVEYVTIGLGDSDNDVALLEATDISVIVSSPSHEPPTLSKQEAVIVSKRLGPEGWADAVEEILDRMSMNNEEDENLSGLDN